MKQLKIQANGYLLWIKTLGRNLVYDVLGVVLVNTYVCLIGSSYYYQVLV